MLWTALNSLTFVAYWQVLADEEVLTDADCIGWRPLRTALLFVALLPCQPLLQMGSVTHGCLRGCLRHSE